MMRVPFHSIDALMAEINMIIKNKDPKEKGIGRAVCSLVDKWSNAEKFHEVLVSGKSMKPLLSPGMNVVVDHNRDSVKKGDIILYLRNNRLILHRIVQVIVQEDGNLFLTKGDSSMSFDKPLVNQDEIIGVVNSILKDKRTIDLKKWQWRCISRVITACSSFTGTLAGYISIFLNMCFKYRNSGIKLKDKEL
jgi:hypothetical protein